jgi:hypothetical protein
MTDNGTKTITDKEAGILGKRSSSKQTMETSEMSCEVPRFQVNDSRWRLVLLPKTQVSRMDSSWGQGSLLH